MKNDDPASFPENGSETARRARSFKECLQLSVDLGNGTQGGYSGNLAGR